MNADDAVNLLVRPVTNSDIYRYCVKLAVLPNGGTVNITNFGWYSPYLSETYIDACNITNLNNYLPNSFPSNTMIILYEHECTMTEHAWNIQTKYGQQITLMIITQRTDSVFQLTYDTTTMPVSIPVLIILDTDFNSMMNRYNNPNNIQLSIDYAVITSNKVRPAILLLFLLILCIFLGGNFWAADEFKQNIKTKTNTTPVQVITRQNSVAPNETLPTANGVPILPMTCCFIAVMICFAVGWLLLLYFFPQVMIYVLQVMFCISSFTCLTRCLNRASYLIPLLRRYKTPSHAFRKPCMFKLGPLNLFTILSMSISLTLVIIWYIYRLTDWAWVLQDILGAAICISVTSMYRLGNMRVITIILILFFLYDVFFVFITPYIPIFQKSSTSTTPVTAAPSNVSTNIRSTSRDISSNPSVMEQVALGLGTNGESIPLLFALPTFIPESEIDPCTTVRMSMIGFGDIILPGILLTFCKIFDIASGNRWPVYYLQSIIAYFVGLSFTYVALYLMQTAQPALLYIVPCLLISTIITSLIRREFKEIYTGKRIQSILEGTIQETPRTSNNNVANPVEQQINNGNNTSRQEINGENNLVRQQAYENYSYSDNNNNTGVNNFTIHV
ncbi:unnamed protein product [Adineta steineri]|uniref:Signal peptide peptidase-like 2B n=1 Tax=Adineta steineri TaxID=433720 RepID=A0A818TNV8_9BILA|nr:unnamed protein product [Adineta steineri]